MDEVEGADMIVMIDEAVVIVVIVVAVVGLVTGMPPCDPTRMLVLGPGLAHPIGLEEIDMAEVGMVEIGIVEDMVEDMESHDGTVVTEIVEVIDLEIEASGGTKVDLLPRTLHQEEHPWRERSSKSPLALSPCRRAPRQLLLLMWAKSPRK